MSLTSTEVGLGPGGEEHGIIHNVDMGERKGLQAEREGRDSEGSKGADPALTSTGDAAQKEAGHREGSAETSACSISL
jgi:hypothetical protein